MLSDEIEFIKGLKYGALACVRNCGDWLHNLRIAQLLDVQQIDTLQNSIGSPNCGVYRQVTTYSPITDFALWDAFQCNHCRLAVQRNLILLSMT